MGHSTTNTLLGDHIIRALCDTLLHSLWQGILLALITGAVILLTKKRSAAFRYNLLIVVLALFASGVMATFIWHLENPASDGAAYSYYSTGSPTGTAQTTAAHLVDAATAPGKTADPIAQRTGSGNFTGLVIGYFNTHYATIVLIWFLIICAKSVQMVVGLLNISHLKRAKVAKVGEDWENRFLHLAKHMHIEQAIRLMESGIAKVPMVVGHLRPVILIPIGIINSLTTTEVEAILLHELAHIRRRDYLVNLLQSLMEIIFFFNPAVLWLSQLIRTERENCCDDLAIAQSRNKGNYIRALLSCEEYQAAGAAYAMAFPGAKNTLRHRVTRMVGNRNYSLSLVEKTVLAVCLVLTGLGISAYTFRTPVHAPIDAPIHHEARTERTEKSNGATAFTQLRRPVLAATNTNTAKHPRAANAPLAFLTKPDTAKPAFDRARAIGRELYLENLLTDTDHLSVSLDDRELIVNGVVMPQNVHERIYSEFGGGGDDGGSLAPPYENKHPGPYDAFLEKQSEEIAAEILNRVRDKNNFSFSLSRNEFTIDGVRQSDELLRKIVAKYFKPTDTFNLNYIYHAPGAYLFNDQKNYSAAADSYQNSASNYQSLGREQNKEQDKINKELVADLLRDGLIMDPKNVSFTLSDKMLLVDGKKQSDEIYRKYKAKYTPDITGSGWNWSYSHHE